jgi:hypothetical protein
MISDPSDYAAAFSKWLDSRGGRMLDCIIYTTGQLEFKLVAPPGMTGAAAIARFEKEQHSAKSSPELERY